MRILIKEAGTKRVTDSVEIAHETGAVILVDTIGNKADIDNVSRSLGYRVNSVVTTADNLNSIWKDFDKVFLFNLDRLPIEDIPENIEVVGLSIQIPRGTGHVRGN